MLVALRRDPLAFAVPAVQGCAGVVALLAESPAASATALAALAGFALLAWWRAAARGRLIADTPTSRIASAAQGYTELRGTGRPLGGDPLRSPMFGLPVLWYRLRTERRRGESWEHLDTVESDASFLLDDGSGECAVDPEGAEMLVTRKDVVDRGDDRLTQWCLIANDPIYALGEFATLGSVSPDFDIAEQVKSLLAEWKRDRAGLLSRFDLDCNGEIDLAEWSLARAAARREIERSQQQVLAAPEAHVMRKPADGRLYLISDLDPQQLARRHRWLSILQLVLFLGALAGAGAFALG